MRRRQEQEKIIYVLDYLDNRLDNVRNDKEYEETQKAIHCFLHIVIKLNKLEEIKKTIKNL